MRKITIFCVFYLASITSSHAQLATFDATQATNMIRQIEQSVEMIEQAEQQVTKLEDMNGNLSGNLGRASGLNGQLNDLKRKYRRLTRSIERLDLGNGTVPDFSDVKDIQQTLDHIYDPATFNRPQKRKLQRLHKQTSKKAALEEAELTINTIEGNLQDVDKLINESDATESLKDSQDMTNKLLIALISNQIQMKNLVAQLTRVEASESYEGVQSGANYQVDSWDAPNGMIDGAVTNWGDGNVPCPDILAEQNKC